MIILGLNPRNDWRRMRDLSSSTWLIPRFLGKRVIKANLAFQDKESSAFLELI